MGDSGGRPCLLMGDSGGRPCLVMGEWWPSLSAKGDSGGRLCLLICDNGGRPCLVMDGRSHRSCLQQWSQSLSPNV
jgi:hypothetical protein